MDKHTLDNMTDNELLSRSEESSYAVQKQLAVRFETLLNELDNIEEGVASLKKKSLDSVRKVKNLILDGELSRARTEANCLKVTVSKSTEVILNLIKGR